MNARVTVFSVNVDCPKCGAAIPEPHSGSLVWEVADQGLKRGNKIECPDCGAQLTIPKTIARL